MVEQVVEVLILLLSIITLCYSNVPAVTLRTKDDCTTYILVHNILQIEWFADSILNCTVEVDTIKTLTEYEHLCIQPKSLHFPNCIAKVTVYEKYTSSPPIMVRNCVNKLDPMFCTTGENPFLIHFEAKPHSSAHVVLRVEGRNNDFRPLSDDDDDDFNGDVLVTQIVLAVGVIAASCAIVICILYSCRHSRYTHCDTSSERSSPRTVQTEVAEGETTRPASMPELDSLIDSCNKQTGSITSQPSQTNTPPPSYWDVLVDDGEEK